MSDCHIDLETRSTVDLRRTGVYVYAEDPTTDVWCAAYAIDDGPVNFWIPTQSCPSEIVKHIASGGMMWAHNAAFERTIWAHILTPRYGWPEVPLEQWSCTMARAYAMALPGALDSASAALGLDQAKDPVGYRTMLRMSKPRRWENDKPVWWDDPIRIKELIAYCVQDVMVERLLHQRLIDLRPQEKAIWLLDAKINERGIRVDRALCNAAKPIVEKALEQLNSEIRITSNGLVSSTDSVAQIVEFCKVRGVPAKSIRKNSVEDMLDLELPDDVRRVLEIRAAAGKASIKKIDALLSGCSRDGRARGLLQYHAASTGRWAGRRFQPQNIKRPVTKPQEDLIPIIMTKSITAVQMLAGPPLEVVGDVLRGMLIAAPGANFYAADYSNIEGRALAWLAGEQWKVDAFRDFDNGNGPDLYRLAYAKAFGIPPFKVNYDQRQVGKVMELALGYQGGIGAFQTMAGAYGVEIEDDHARELTRAWRDAHRKIQRLWLDAEAASMLAIAKPGLTVACGKLAFKVAGSFLFMRLPSGRALCYPYPKIQNVQTPWGTTRPAITYKSVVNPSNNRRVVKDPGNTSNWSRISTYGGSLVENATQAVARDVMAEAMLRVEAAGFPVVLTCHDEIVSEAEAGDVEEFQSLMETPPVWAGGFPITAKAWIGSRYKKD